MRGKLTKCLAALVLAAGLALMLYPWISNWVYEHAAESTASAYSTAVGSCSTGELEAGMGGCHGWGRIRWGWDTGSYQGPACTGIEEGGRN